MTARERLTSLLGLVGNNHARKRQENLFPKEATIILPPDLCRSTLQAGVGTNQAHTPPSLVQPPPRKQGVHSLSSNKSFQFAPYHHTFPSALSLAMLPALSIPYRCCLGLCPPGAGSALSLSREVFSPLVKNQEHSLLNLQWHRSTSIPRHVPRASTAHHTAPASPRESKANVGWKENGGRKLYL